MNHMESNRTGIDNILFEPEGGECQHGKNSIRLNDEVDADRCSKPTEEIKLKSKWCSSIYDFKDPTTLQKITRIISILLISLVLWFTLYIILGDTVAPPKGKVFQIIIVSGSAMLAGWIVSLTNLPGLIGMLFIGAVYQNCGVIDLDGSFTHINKFLRGIALIVILVRAGLGLDPSALRRLKFDLIKLGLLPWLLESLFVGMLAYFILDLPLSYGLALGFATSAISPAVTVPSLLRLKAKGYGITKGIPTLVMAITTLTDVFSVVCFGIIQSFIFSTSTTTNLILQLPVSIIGGISFGVFWGIICSYIPASYDLSNGPLRVMLLFSGGILSVFGSEAVGFSGAGPLACVVAPFVAIMAWTKEGWKLGDNPVTVSFKCLWMVFEPVLFAITGAQIKLNQLDGHVMLLGTGILIAGVLIRTSVTVVLGIGSILNLREKIFSSIAMATKATVQAALAPVLLELITDKTSKDYQHAERVMMICILSIVVTTPPIAIFMDIFGSRFLKKDVVNSPQEPVQTSLDQQIINANTNG